MCGVDDAADARRQHFRRRRRFVARFAHASRGSQRLVSTAQAVRCRRRRHPARDPRSTGRRADGGGAQMRRSLSSARRPARWRGNPCRQTRCRLVTAFAFVTRGSVGAAGARARDSRPRHGDEVAAVQHSRVVVPRGNLCEGVGTGDEEKLRGLGTCNREPLERDRCVRRVGRRQLQVTGNEVVRRGRGQRHHRKPMEL